MLGAIVLVAGGGLAAYVFAPRTTEAPDFALTSTGWENGTETEPVNFTLHEYRGRVVVLDFMAVLCTSCRHVTEHVLKPLDAEGLTGVTILSIDTWADPETGELTGAETRAAVVRLQQEEDVPWRHALDTDDVWRKYAAVALPKLVVVDPDGGIAYVASGAKALDGDSLREAVLDARDGRPTAASIPQAGLLALAAAAGVASFFAPCALGLLPAYLGVLLKDNAAHPVVAGLKVSAGMAASYAIIAIAIVVAANFGQSEAMQQALPELELLMGLLLVALGALLLARFDWSRLARACGLGQLDGRRSMPAFGVAYALASFACTGPILLPILIASVGHGPAGVLGAYGVYCACLAVFLVVMAGLVGAGKHRATQLLLRHANAVNRASAVLILLGGAYLIWFYATALR